MIQIDDSGSGSPVGGVGIGLYRVETGEFVFDMVPVRYFQGIRAGQKEYLGEIVRIVEASLAALGVAPGSDTLEVCRGNVFGSLKPWLDAQGHLWQEARIEGECQRLVEAAYAEHLASLGVPRSALKNSEDYRALNHRLEVWVGQSFRDRASVCKQWGKGWQRLCERYAV